jgi:hypothetical protein
MVQTPDPVDAWGYLTAKTARLQVIVGLLSVSVLVLSGVIGWYIYRGIPIYYIPPGGPGVAQPGIIPESSATDVASRCLQARYTFMPSTMKAMHKDFLLCLHPSLHADFKAKADKEAVMVKENHMSAQAGITTTTVSQRTAEQVTVVLEGIRAVWIGGVQVREEPLHAEMTIVPWLAQGRPAGLVVAKMSVTPMLSVQGR